MRRALTVGLRVATSLALLGGAILMASAAPPPALARAIVTKASAVTIFAASAPEADVAPPRVRMRPRAHLRPVDTPATPAVEDEDEESFREPALR